MIKGINQIKPYQKVVYSIILFIAIVWCAGILAAPLWAGEPDVRGGISKVLYTFFSTSCHQDPGRSLSISGSILGVCSRCTFVYFGFLLSVLIIPFVRKLNNLSLPPIWILLAGAGLIALDVFLDSFGIWNNTFLSREITGAAIGVILPFYIIPGSINLVNELFSPAKIIPKK